WNSSRVVVKGKHLQHYLNGELVVDIVVGSDHWKKAHGQSKFKGRKNFAHNKSGRIFLQDHNDKVWYRKLEIKTLK
ncbi:MAG: 3-keto-disaccharide hydrolase, partial [Akkermansiaceae bacterium]